MAVQRIPHAEIVDVDALLSVVGASLVAGLSLAFIFSVSIACATRAAELRREGRRVGAAALVTLSGVGLLACVALVAVGLQVMVSK